MRIRLPLILCLLLLAPGAAQTQTTPVEGLRENPPAVHALTNARIVIEPGRTVENATLVIRNGVIESVGADVNAPPDARVWDLTGRTLYAGFIDAYSEVGMRTELPEADAEAGRGAVYWNPQVRSFVDAAAEFSPEDDDALRALRSQGFTVAMAVPQLGMFRGRTSALSLGGGTVADRVVRSGLAQSLTLSRDREVGGTYPTSSMGAIAFVRQTLHDTDWHARARAAYERDPRGARRPESNDALRALVPVREGRQPLLVETHNEEELLRVLRLRDELGLQLWLRGSGGEYRMLEQLRALDAPLILPVNFPDAPTVEPVEEALNRSLAELRHWHLAPENPGRLAAAGVEFAFTSHQLRDRGRFLDNVRHAVSRGLAPEQALAALTIVPARYLGVERTHGTLEPGKVASVVVVEGDLFRDDDAAVEAVWVDGERFEVRPPVGADPQGVWAVSALGAEPLEGELRLEGTRPRLTGTFIAPGGEVRLTRARVAGDPPRVEISFPGEVLGVEGTVRMSGRVTREEIQGWSELPDGRRVSWRATRVEGEPASDGAPRAERAAGSGGAAAGTALALSDIRPAMEFGRERLPERPDHVLVRNATVWTMGPQGVLENADLLVRRGQVIRVGQGLSAPSGAVVIDATGKHVTPGLVDPHIHSGVSGGVNDVGNAIVPEVRVGDVMTMNNIWTYRQLAGGLTSAHVLHGSANPIGGENVHVKMRWGAPAEELKLEGAPRTVKFALGENVKRRTGRYPDTRMGTEQVIRDHFQAAREYEAAWREWERGRQRGIPPRRDLRMEALVDILNGHVQIHAHAYRQDEMLMLMRLAEEFGLTVFAFHHALEGFKIGPELARHGAGAVVWSDWSSFKVEAYDATVYNARLLNDAGVLTSLHSDNSQIASRMNWEAGKLLRTGVSEDDALAMVTINAARLAGIGDRVGSLEPDKDADFVIWSGHPLSTMTRAEQTWVDGRRYFDIEEDRRLRQQVERERAQLIQLILNER